MSRRIFRRSHCLQPTPGRPYVASSSSPASRLHGPDYAPTTLETHVLLMPRCHCEAARVADNRLLQARANSEKDERLPTIATTSPSLSPHWSGRASLVTSFFRVTFLTALFLCLVVPVSSSLISSQDQQSLLAHCLFGGKPVQITESPNYYNKNHMNSPDIFLLSQPPLPVDEQSFSQFTIRAKVSKAYYLHVGVVANLSNHVLALYESKLDISILGNNNYVTEPIYQRYCGLGSSTVPLYSWFIMSQNKGEQEDDMLTVIISWKGPTIGRNYSIQLHLFAVSKDRSFVNYIHASGTIRGAIISYDCPSFSINNMPASPWNPTLSSIRVTAMPLTESFIRGQPAVTITVQDIHQRQGIQGFLASCAYWNSTAQALRPQEGVGKWYLASDGSTMARRSECEYSSFREFDRRRKFIVKLVYSPPTDDSNNAIVDEPIFCSILVLLGDGNTVYLVYPPSPVFIPPPTSSWRPMPSTKPTSLSTTQPITTSTSTTTTTTTSVSTTTPTTTSTTTSTTTPTTTSITTSTESSTALSISTTLSTSARDNATVAIPTRKALRLGRRRGPRLRRPGRRRKFRHRRVKVKMTTMPVRTFQERRTVTVTAVTEGATTTKEYTTLPYSSTTESVAWPSTQTIEGNGNITEPQAPTPASSSLITDFEYDCFSMSLKGSSAEPKYHGSDAKADSGVAINSEPFVVSFLPANVTGGTELSVVISSVKPSHQFRGFLVRCTTSLNEQFKSNAEDVGKERGTSSGSVISIGGHRSKPTTDCPVQGAVVKQSDTRPKVEQILFLKFHSSVEESSDAIVTCWATVVVDSSDYWILSASTVLPIQPKNFIGETVVPEVITLTSMSELAPDVTPKPTTVQTTLTTDHQKTFEITTTAYPTSKISSETSNAPSTTAQVEKTEPPTSLHEVVCSAMTLFDDGSNENETIIGETGNSVIFRVLIADHDSYSGASDSIIVEGSLIFDDDLLVEAYLFGCTPRQQVSVSHGAGVMLETGGHDGQVHNKTLPSSCGENFRQHNPEYWPLTGHINFLWYLPHTGEAAADAECRAVLLLQNGTFLLRRQHLSAFALQTTDATNATSSNMEETIKSEYSYSRTNALYGFPPKTSCSQLVSELLSPHRFRDCLDCGSKLATLEFVAASVKSGGNLTVGLVSADSSFVMTDFVVTCYAEDTGQPIGSLFEAPIQSNLLPDTVGVLQPAKVPCRSRVVRNRDVGPVYEVFFVWTLPKSIALSTKQLRCSAMFPFLPNETVMIVDSSPLRRVGSSFFAPAFNYPKPQSDDHAIRQRQSAMTSPVPETSTYMKFRILPRFKGGLDRGGSKDLDFPSPYSRYSYSCHDFKVHLPESSYRRDSSPFKLDLSSTNFYDGQNLLLTINGSDTMVQSFRGFMTLCATVYGYNDDAVFTPEAPAGRLVETLVDGRVLSTSGGCGSRTENSLRQLKTSVAFLWKAPKLPEFPIQCRAIVVVNDNNYWILDGPIMHRVARPTVSAPTTTPVTNTTTVVTTTTATLTTAIPAFTSTTSTSQEKTVTSATPEGEESTTVGTTLPNNTATVSNGTTTIANATGYGVANESGEMTKTVPSANEFVSANQSVTNASYYAETVTSLSIAGTSAIATDSSIVGENASFVAVESSGDLEPDNMDLMANQTVMESDSATSPLFAGVREENQTESLEAIKSDNQTSLEINADIVSDKMDNDNVSFNFPSGDGLMANEVSITRMPEVVSTNSSMKAVIASENFIEVSDGQLSTALPPGAAVENSTFIVAPNLSNGTSTEAVEDNSPFAIELTKTNAIAAELMPAIVSTKKSPRQESFSEKSTPSAFSPALFARGFDCRRDGHFCRLGGDTGAKCDRLTGKCICSNSQFSGYDCSIAELLENNECNGGKGCFSGGICGRRYTGWLFDKWMKSAPRCFCPYDYTGQECETPRVSAQCDNVNGMRITVVPFSNELDSPDSIFTGSVRVVKAQNKSSESSANSQKDSKQQMLQDVKEECNFKHLTSTNNVFVLDQPFSFLMDECGARANANNTMIYVQFMIQYSGNDMLTAFDPLYLVYCDLSSPMAATQKPRKRIVVAARHSGYSVKKGRLASFLQRPGASTQRTKGQRVKMSFASEVAVSNSVETLPRQVIVGFANATQLHKASGKVDASLLSQNTSQMRHNMSFSVRKRSHGPQTQRELGSREIRLTDVVELEVSNYDTTYFKYIYMENCRVDFENSRQPGAVLVSNGCPTATVRRFLVDWMAGGENSRVGDILLSAVGSSSNDSSTASASFAYSAFWPTDSRALSFNCSVHLCSADAAEACLHRACPIIPGFTFRRRKRRIRREAGDLEPSLGDDRVYSLFGSPKFFSDKMASSHLDLRSTIWAATVISVIALSYLVGGYWLVKKLAKAVVSTF